MNADFYEPRGVVIKLENHRLTLENPGYIRVGKKQFMLGGVSDPRNKGLMKMFNLIDIGERAGSGVPDIQKLFHKRLFSPFAKACKTYQLISEGDHIAVCISGGKDSMLMAKLFQEIQKHRKVQFGLTFLVMDPGYNKENRELIESNSRALGIPITVFESDIFDAVDISPEK